MKYRATITETINGSTSTWTDTFCRHEDAMAWGRVCADYFIEEHSEELLDGCESANHITIQDKEEGARLLFDFHVEEID